MDLIKIAEQAFAQENAIEIPSFNTGDTISVHYKIKEGNKERIQIFKGVVIQIKGTGTTKTFTVRKMSGNVGVERIIPFNSPYIHAIEVNKRGVVRRSRIFYFVSLPERKQKLKRRNFNLSFSHIKKPRLKRGFFIKHFLKISSLKRNNLIPKSILFI